MLFISTKYVIYCAEHTHLTNLLSTIQDVIYIVLSQEDPGSCLTIEYWRRVIGGYGSLDRLGEDLWQRAISVYLSPLLCECGVLPYRVYTN